MRPCEKSKYGLGNRARYSPEPDIALAVLCHHFCHGESLQLTEIAEATGLSFQGVRMIERRALKKLRQSFRHVRQMLTQ